MNESDTTNTIRLMPKKSIQLFVKVFVICALSLGFHQMAVSKNNVAITLRKSKIVGRDNINPVVIIVAVPSDNSFSTKAIQQAIDSCAIMGGGTVWLKEGTYRTKTIRLKSNVKLYLDKNCLLQGSDNYLDYGTGRRGDALITGENLENITITGSGTIDGVDCYNPDGEEEFRGPHGIRLRHCNQIIISGITIRNAGNWAINLRNCNNILIDSVSIRGGHDGLHTRFCSDITVSNCDFRTGDDAFAGNDNQSMTVTNTKINSACHGFRIGCNDLTVENCSIWGPAEYEHKVSKRTNMLSAFTHFSPRGENPQIISGNWLIKNVVADQIDYFFHYNYQDGLWQTGQPMSSVKFENITATNLGKSFFINAGDDIHFEMEVLNAVFTSRGKPGTDSMLFEDVEIYAPAFCNVSNFNSVKIFKTSFSHIETEPVSHFSNGKSLTLDAVQFFPKNIKNDHFDNTLIYSDIETFSLQPAPNPETNRQAMTLHSIVDYPGVIVIDGIANEGFWQMIEPNTLTHDVRVAFYPDEAKPIDPQLKTSGNYHLTWKACYDDVYFYIYCVIIDDDMQPRSMHRGDEPWLNDNITLFFLFADTNVVVTDLAKSFASELRIWIDTDITAMDSISGLGWSNKMIQTHGHLAYTSRTQLTEYGYNVEARIPWRLIIPPADISQGGDISINTNHIQNISHRSISELSVFQFDIQGVDRDHPEPSRGDKRHIIQSWSAGWNRNWIDTNWYGRIILGVPLKHK